MEQSLDQLPPITQKQSEYTQQIELLKEQENTLVENRKICPHKIKLYQMPENLKYNQLKTESKLLMNVIKMICYRAESAVASLVAPFLQRATDEKRMFIKQLIHTNADLIPNYENNTLTIVLHSLSAPRFNKAAHFLCQLLNDTETSFPSTNLRMIFKTSAFLNCDG